MSHRGIFNKTHLLSQRTSASAAHLLTRLVPPTAVSPAGSSGPGPAPCSTSMPLLRRGGTVATLTKAKYNLTAIEEARVQFVRASSSNHSDAGDGLGRLFVEEEAVH